MRNVIDLSKYRRARRQETHDRRRRALPQPLSRGMVSIGVVSAELVRRLTETE